MSDIDLSDIDRDGLASGVSGAADVRVHQVTIELSHDDSPRVLELATELADPIREAVKRETRAARLAMALDTLRAAR